MAKCYVCQKSTSIGNRVSHANNRTKRFWAPNLQRIRIREGQTVRRRYVCTSCIKAGKVTKAV
jgi:large subunit ribosomal protein L28